MPDVTMIVNPGRRARDKVLQKDVGPGEDFTCSEKEARLAEALGIASRAPPPKRAYTKRALEADPTPAARAADPEPAAALPPAEAAPSASEPDGDSEGESERPRRQYRRRDFKAEE